MKKILWLCNIAFSDIKIKTTASWLQPLAELLQASGEVQLYNITLGNTTKVEQTNYKGIHLWIIPNNQCYNHGQEATAKVYNLISDIEQQISPDLVHIWGTESIWADAYRKGYIKSKALLDIQGLLALCYHFYNGGLSTRNILQSIHLKEIIMPWRNLFEKKRIFKKRAKIETQNIKSFSFISYQSKYVRNYISYINPQAKTYSTKIMLRDSFYNAKPWTFKKTDSPIIFTTASGAIPYKGIHILFKSIQIIKKKYPKIQLRIAGQMKIGNLLIDGYSIYLEKLIQKYDLNQNIVLLGPLDETNIVKELQNCNVCVIPSFVETYCLAFAESLIIGVPTIATFVGAMPELATHNKECLFYNPLDFYMCAYYIDLLLTDKDLAEQISSNARKKRLLENDKKEVIINQLNIYENIINI